MYKFPKVKDQTTKTVFFLRQKPGPLGKDSPFQQNCWVAVKELKLSYHNGDI